MRITSTAVSFNVADPDASARFLQDHFGFTVTMSADGFTSLTREDAGINVIYLRTGLPTFKPTTIAGDAGMGTLLVFVVDDIDAEWERLGVLDLSIPTPIETEPWGERYFQVADPNGIVVQLVQWVAAPDGSPAT